MLKTKFAGVLLAGLAFAGSSQAATVSYYLNQSNSLADGVNYLQVTISDERKAGVIDFTVTALQPLLDLAGDNFGITQFAFNIANGIHAQARNLTLLPSNWKARNGGKKEGFGVFDVRLGTEANWRGNHLSPANPEDPLTFSIAGVRFDTIESYVGLAHGRAPEGLSLFSAHVSGLNLAGCENPASANRRGAFTASGHGSNGGCNATAVFGGGPLTSAVPAPPALWLLGTGLAGLVVRRFRAAGRTPA